MRADVMSPGPIVLACIVALASMAGALPAHAQAGGGAAALTAQRQIDLPAQPLGNALNALARAWGVAISVDAALVTGRNAPAQQGAASLGDALARALAGSGLVAVPTGAAITVQPRPQEGAALAAVTVTAQAERSAWTEGSDSYTVRAAAVGGKMGETLREVPRSISVLSRQQLDDQRVMNLYDAMNQLPGVTATYGAGNGDDLSFYARGYRLDNITADGLGIAARGLTDGNARGGGSNAGMAKYDSVQLLRGPDGLFSGNGQPSGTINLVRKHPTDRLQIKTAISAGSWSNHAGEIDLSAPLSADGRVRGRLVAARNTTDHFYASTGNRKSTFYGIVDIDLAPMTLLSVGGSRDTVHGAPDQPPGLPRYSDGTPLRVGRGAGYPSWATRNYDVDNLFASLEHRFDDSWKLKAGVSQTRTRNGYNNISAYSGAVDPRTQIGQGSYATQADWNNEVKAVDVHVTGDMQVFGRQLKLAFGADYSDMEQFTVVGGVASNDPIRNQPINWSHFDSATSLRPWANSPQWDNLTRHRQQGVYGYGNFQVYGPLKLVLGGRYASFDSHSTGAHSASGSCTIAGLYCGDPVRIKEKDNSGIFTPYYALTYDFAERWTAYLTMARSYEDQSNNYTSERTPLDPTTGRSWELGLKGEHWGGRLNSNITVYRSKRENYAVRVSGDDAFDLPGKNCCYAGNGQFLAQGVEVDVSGAITPHWQLNAGYTFDDNKTEYGSNDGKRYASYTPKHILRLWSSYRLQGSLAGWKLGGGAQAQSQAFRSGTVRTWNPTGGPDQGGAFDGPAQAYDFKSPSRVVWNAFVEYRFNPNWSAALNVNNVFDKSYYQAVGTTANGNFYGAPRSWLMTLRGAF